MFNPNIGFGLRAYQKKKEVGNPPLQNQKRTQNYLQTEEKPNRRRVSPSFEGETADRLGSNDAATKDLRHAITSVSKLVQR